MDTDSLYQALASRDPRFDGRFFVGVASTGIYCRPVCPARTPRRAGCQFFETAAAAEGAGFRPCLRCRPELAPGLAPVDAVDRLAGQALRRMQADPALPEGLEGLAADLGVSGRHLGRVFQATWGVSPRAYLQTQRLLAAKWLLTDTDLPMDEVAHISGFPSARRLQATFQSRYGLCPTDLRKGRKPRGGEGLPLRLALRPPHDLRALLGFLSLRAIPGVEAGGEGSYRRVLSLEGRRGWVEVREGAGALEVRVDPRLAPVLPRVRAALVRLFDLEGRPEEVAARLGSLAEGHPGLRVPGCVDGFEMAVRAVLGQQVTVQGARTLAGRLVAALGDPVATPFPDLDRAFPTPEQVLGASLDTLGGLGILRSRSSALHHLARAVSREGLRLEPGVDVPETLARLQALPGIGDWTAQYLAMRALAWPDAFLPTDAGVKKAFPGWSPARIRDHAEGWRPWRAYAVMHLWEGDRPCLEP